MADINWKPNALG